MKNKIKIRPLNRGDVCLVVNEPNENKIVVAIKTGVIFTDHYFCDSRFKKEFIQRKNLFKIGTF